MDEVATEVVPETGIDKTTVDTIDTVIRGVQDIPELQGAPNTIDVTSLEDLEEMSDPGLISGSSLAITMNYKEGVWGAGVEDKSNFEQCLAISNDSIYRFKIVLPNGRWFALYAKARTVIGAMPLASAQTYQFILFKKSKVETGITVTTFSAQKATVAKTSQDTQVTSGSTMLK